MQLTASDFAAPQRTHKPACPTYAGKPTDIDWEAAKKSLDNKPAKEIADSLNISLVAVYKAADRGDITICYLKGKKKTQQTKA